MEAAVETEAVFGDQGGFYGRRVEAKPAKPSCGEISRRWWVVMIGDENDGDSRLYDHLFTKVNVAPNPGFNRPLGCFPEQLPKNPSSKHELRIGCDE
jgi:hypothetical protein